jgi:hypothetical protein
MEGSSLIFEERAGVPLYFLTELVANMFVLVHFVVKGIKKKHPKIAQTRRFGLIYALFS